MPGDDRPSGVQGGRGDGRAGTERGLHGLEIYQAKPRYERGLERHNARVLRHHGGFVKAEN